MRQSDRWGLSPVPLRVCVAAPGRQRMPWARGGGAAVLSTPQQSPPGLEFLAHLLQ